MSYKEGQQQESKQKSLPDSPCKKGGGGQGPRHTTLDPVVSTTIQMIIQESVGKVENRLNQKMDSVEYQLAVSTHPSSTLDPGEISPTTRLTFTSTLTVCGSLYAGASLASSLQTMHRP